MQLTCPNCGAEIPARQINIQKLVAVCETCDAIFSIDDSQISGEPWKRKRRKVPQPEKFHVVEADGEVHVSFVTRENMSWLEYIMGAVALVFGGPLALATFSLVFSGSFIPALITSVISFICLYLVAAIGLNKVEVNIDDEQFSTQEGPVYVFANKQIPRDDVLGFWMDRAGLDDDPDSDYYNIYALLRDDRKKPFIQYLQREHAQFILQVLEEYITLTHAEDNLITRGDDTLEDDDFMDDEAWGGEGEIETDAAGDDDDQTGDALSLEELLREERKRDNHQG